MKTAHGHAPMKSKGSSTSSGRLNAQQVILELKHKVVLALNKLADRDTYQIGVDELEKIAESLNPEGIASFLSCILDTDSEQKSSVRKECVRLMGTLARFHEALISPYIGKIVSSVVKRLKDPDSVVRDACLETMGILAMKLGGHAGQGDGVFLMLVRPLFEALGEQNKQVQTGSALCLARVIDNTHDPPSSLLHRMLTRTTKLLKNPHFLAKPAVIELNRSIIQAGGATAENVLSAAMSSIQEALKNTDWATRKAASMALAEIALCTGPLMGCYRASCIRSLELCRFDKVKPVRDSVAQALNCWKCLPGQDTPEPSDAGSSIKDSFFGGDYDVTISREKESTYKKVVADATKKNNPWTVKKACPNYAESPNLIKPDNWHVEIAIPNKKVSSVGFNQEELISSSISKINDKLSANKKSRPVMVYELTMDDNEEESASVSEIATASLGKSGTVSQDCLENNGLLRSERSELQFMEEEVNSERCIHPEKVQDRRSLDSTVTDSRSMQMSHECCVQTAKEMVCIRKQLSEIENKQSNILDLVQVFIKSTAESLSFITSKVLALEQAVCTINGESLDDEKDSLSVSCVLMKKKKNVDGSSPKHSTTCTPRPSVEFHDRNPPVMLTRKKAEPWEDKVRSGGRLSNSSKLDLNMWGSSPVLGRNYLGGRDTQKKCRAQAPRSRRSDIMTREDESVVGSKSKSNGGGLNGPYYKNSSRRCMKDFLSDGDLDSAYAEALLSGNESVLIELLNGTGPVLEGLSQNIASDVLSVLALYFIEQRYMRPIIPWLQQVVDLCSIHGPEYFKIPLEAKQELLSAIQDAVKMEFPTSVERRSVAQLAMELRQIWGK